MGSAAHGTYNMSAGSLLVGKSEYVGNSGAGTFNQSGGTHTVTGNLYLGYNNGSSEPSRSLAPPASCRRPTNTSATVPPPRP